MIKGEENEKVLFCAKIFLLIIEIIIVGIIAFIFFGVSKVNAQTIGYVMSNNNLQHCTLLGGDCQWTQFNNNASTNIAVTRKPTMLIGLWSGVQKGSISGIYDIQISVPNGTTCNDLKGGAYVLDSTSRLDSAINYPNCSISGNTASLRITFTTINPTDNNTIQLVYPIPTNNAGGTYYGVGSIDLTTIDNATSQDITQQTIDIINNAIQNSLNQSQTIINESNTLGNRIESIINSATNSIQNSLLHCETNQIIFNRERYNSNTNDISGFLTSSGTITNNQNWKVSEYIELTANQTYTLKGTNTWVNYPAYCIYDINETIENCYLYDTTQINKTLNYNTNKKIRISYSKESNFILSLKGVVCRNSTDAIIENQNQNTDRFINYMVGAREAEEEDWEEEKGLLQSILSAIGGIFSSSIDDPSNTLNSFNNSIASNGTITSLLLLPVTIYQKVINSINATCVDITLGTLWNTTLTMPCLHIDGIIGNALYGTIDVIISGFFILAIRKRFISIFNNLSSLKTGGNELE